MDEHAGDRGAVMGPEPDPGELIVGRDAELARLFRAVDSVSADPVLMLVGDMGTGKSALLEHAVHRAEAGGARVLRAEGSESESSLAFSALHQLLRPVPAEVDALPGRQRAALQDAFGEGSATPGPDLMLVGVAVLSLLSDLGDHHPVLVVLDDAQWFDRASLDALSFVARRLEGEPVTMLIGARGGDHLPGFDRHVPMLTLGPLDKAAANQLLDLQPKSPTGHTRSRILDQAGGNPLALLELTRTASAQDTAAGVPSAGPLPLTDHLERIFAARLNSLPASTMRALLLLAAMDSADSAIAVSAGLPRAEDAALLASAAVQAARLAVLTVRHTVVFSRLADAAEQLAAFQPAAGLDLVAGAAVVRFYSGEDTQRHRIQDVLRRLPENASHAGLRTWVRAVSDPFDGRAQLVSLLPQLAAEAEERPERLTAVGIMAWLLDETPQAVRAFDEAFDRWELQGALPEGLGGAVAWAYLERGRWEQAREACARTTAVGRAAGLDHAVACAAAVDATLLAFQGDASSARTRAEDALALIDPLESRSVSVYARRALGAAAAAEGAYETAYGQLRMVFTADGAPVHYHASYPALADLAAAAVRCGRHEEAALIVERSASALADNASPRLRALISRARGLLADPDDAEPHFRAALADPALEYWPFERAQTLLDLAEWLRRRRRIAEARGPLTEALETFRRLGARPWIERARAESRAAGLDVTDAAPDALAELSPQQQQIIRLAARGLTNREIGEKLFLSPRTVSSHLYRSFPKLGITARSQLRDLIEGTLATAGHQE
ncbi:AAA family ATPase [Streptomyces canus]|uniref:helix-turn-helix transcriptional regulator n=1 Tax=Streptomyces canus TaxID=58343 RepID=UPI0033D3E4EC